MAAATRRLINRLIQSQSRTLLLALIAGVCLLPIAGWWFNREIIPPVEREFPHGALVVAVDASYPPFAVATADDLFGLDIDLARALGDQIGLPVQFVNMGFDGLYDSLIGGGVDVVISAIVPDGQLLGDVAYTDTYFNAGLILVSPANRPITTMEAIAGRSLAYEFGSGADSEVRTWSRRVGNFQAMPYERPTHALDAVRAGDAEAALVDATDGLLYLRDHPDWQATYAFVTGRPFVMAVRRDRPGARLILDRALDELIADGTLDLIITRWFGNDALQH